VLAIGDEEDVRLAIAPMDVAELVRLEIALPIRARASVSLESGRRWAVRVARGRLADRLHHGPHTLA
jgi:hypothetical protein